MAFPASPSNNEVHKEGTRSFVWDSTLGVWDQVREVDRTEIKTITSGATAQGNLTVVGDFVPSEPLSHRNLVINGGMQVFQRATATTTATSGYFTADRWAMYENLSAGTFTTEKHTMSAAERNTTGHSTALQFNCTGADTSIATGEYSYFWQHIEGQNLQHLQYGTANAKTITLSFWVKSSKTGTYCAGIRKIDTTMYHILDEYTISSADTWEKKTITFTPTAGDTSHIIGSGGIIDNDNGVGLQLHFGLTWGTQYGSGTTQTWSTSTAYYATTNQVNWFDSTSNDFYITGVQLELGSNATPFEHRSYGEELARCLRYYWRIVDKAESHPVGDGYYYNSSSIYGTIRFPVTMRTSPTMHQSGGSDEFRFYRHGDQDRFDVFVLRAASRHGLSWYNSTNVSGTEGEGGWVESTTSAGWLAFTAEI